MKGDIGFPDAPDPRDLERAARWPSEEAQAVYERSRFAQRAQAVAGRGQNPDTQPYVGDDDHAEPWIDRGGRDTRSPALEAHDILRLKGFAAVTGSPMRPATRRRKPGRSRLASSSTSTSRPVSISPQVEALTNGLSDWPR